LPLQPPQKQNCDNNNDDDSNQSIPFEEESFDMMVGVHD
jgi:hypothetical protein